MLIHVDPNKYMRKILIQILLIIERPKSANLSRKGYKKLKHADLSRRECKAPIVPTPVEEGKSADPGWSRKLLSTEVA